MSHKPQKEAQYMKKPEKKNFCKEVCMWRDDANMVKEIRGECRGYNIAIEEMDAYHEWDIENNYVRRDRLPSVDELECEINIKSHFQRKDGGLILPEHKFKNIIKAIAKLHNEEVERRFPKIKEL